MARWCVEHTASHRPGKTYGGLPTNLLGARPPSRIGSAARTLRGKALKIPGTGTPALRPLLQGLTGLTLALSWVSRQRPVPVDSSFRVHLSTRARLHLLSDAPAGSCRQQPGAKHLPFPNVATLLQLVEVSPVAAMAKNTVFVPAPSPVQRHPLMQGGHSAAHDSG